MTDRKDRRTINEEKIREAVHRELNGIEAPPPEMMWRRIEGGIGRKKPAVFRRRHNWLNLSAVAAALLVFVFGSVHLYNSLLGPATREGAQIAENSRSCTLAGDTGAMETDEQPYLSFESEQFVSIAGLPPETINGTFMLEQSASRVGPNGEQYDFAVYSAEGGRLLWVRALPAAANLTSLLSDLSVVIEVELEPSVTVNGALSFYADGRPGLAWHEDNFTYAVWVISGYIPPNYLTELPGTLVK